MKRICVIIGAGDEPVFRKKYNREECLIIAADGGYDFLKKERIIPDLWIGDLDSAGTSAEDNNGNEVKLIKLPCEKDDTDTFAAVKYAMNEGCEEFHIYGGTGGRLDHTIANIKVLSFLASIGKQAWLYSSTEAVTVIENSELELGNKQEGYVSVFSLTEKSEGVSIKGLKYSLDNSVLLETDQVGVSNEFTGTEAVIGVKKGKLLITVQDI